MLDEAAKGCGLELGARFVVHRNPPPFSRRDLCSCVTASIEALPRLGRAAAANLVHRQILLVGGDEPAIAERILDAADAVAVKLVRHRPDELCPSRNGALDRGV